MNFNVSSYHSWYFPGNYPRLTSKFKKQKLEVGKTYILEVGRLSILMYLF